MKLPQSFKKFMLSAAIISGGVGVAGVAMAADAHPAEQSLVKDGNFYADMRYRYEFVDQDGPAPVVNDARASTLRTKVGFKTGVYNDFQGLIEFENVGSIGADSYNDTVNGKTAYPVVADPTGTELNQLWLNWSGLPDTNVKAGRQIVNIDNQRFVGSVGWRQNDQTFDAISVTNTSLPDTTLSYTYAWNINRINGGDHSLGDLSTETHFVNGSYKFADWLKATGYAYLLDIDLVPARSSQTYGVRLTGKAPINDKVSFFYEAEVATQDDYENNPADYDENYYHVAPGIKWGGWTAKVGFESLGGDGTNAFQTPLATGHKFNGWADKFLNTPAGGLEDIYGALSYKVSGVNDFVDGVKLMAVYHDFDEEDGSDDYGDEWNLVATKTFTDGPDFIKNYSLTVKYASYDADDLFTDTEKLWLQVGVKF